jgi:predicted lipid-binding transport protein (Tim44 family)
LHDIREYTSPEIFAEIQLQLQERGDGENHTEVVNISAELLDLTTQPQGLLASVLFSGMIREERNKSPVEIKEVWHFYKFDVNNVWLITGIQQN